MSDAVYVAFDTGGDDSACYMSAIGSYFRGRMKQPPAYFRCEECLRIARALKSAWRADKSALREKLQSVAASSGRDPDQLRLGWVSSIAAMSDDEMRTLLDAHYPTVARVNRDRASHEAATGHVVPLHAGWVLAAYGGDVE